MVNNAIRIEPQALCCQHDTESPLGWTCRFLPMVAVVLAAMTGCLWGATYVESIDGDLSDDYLAPTPVVLGVGSNLLVGTLAGSETDLDLFTLVVPAGGELVAIRILEFSGGENGSFLGFQPGMTLSDDPALGSNFPSPIGFALITAADAARDEDVLDTIVVGPPFFFARPLLEGNYAGWLNETGPASSYQIDFVVARVPEPSTGIFWCVTSLVWLGSRRR